MDEVIVCTCGNTTWDIGTGGIRCSKCYRGLIPQIVKYQNVIEDVFRYFVDSGVSPEYPIYNRVKELIGGE